MTLLPGRWKIGTTIYVAVAATLAGFGAAFEDYSLLLAALLLILPVGYVVVMFTEIFLMFAGTQLAAAAGDPTAGAGRPAEMILSGIVMATLCAIGALANVVALRLACEMTRDLCRWRSTARG
jgi:hypothetical protein